MKDKMIWDFLKQLSLLSDRLPPRPLLSAIHRHYNLKQFEAYAYKINPNQKHQDYLNPAHLPRPIQKTPPFAELTLFQKEKKCTQ